MTAEEIKRIVDGERTEQLTAQLCNHWEVATERLERLVRELTTDMDACVGAEIYAALMRMQRAVMCLMELNKMPTAFLFDEYLDRIDKTVSNPSIRQSVMTLFQQLSDKELDNSSSSFYQLLSQSLVQHMALSKDEQEAILLKASPMQHIFSVFSQHLKPEDLMVVLNIFQNINAGYSTANQKETNDLLTQMRQKMDDLYGLLNESLQMMLIGLLLLMLLPGLLLSMMQQGKADSRQMALLFNKVHTHVRASKEWRAYWENRKQTLRVVSDSTSWKDILTAERSKERAELGQVPGGLFAKWTTDRGAFEAQFLKAGLSDDDIRHFIFHLAVLSEIAGELDPKTKYRDERLVNNEQHGVAEAVMSAATKLYDLVSDGWFPYYDAMWGELIQDETIFAHLKVTRKSPHNNMFTARFFCHLVGEMKKSAVFGGHSDRDLALKLTDKYSVDTFRKNIQEGMNEETQKARNSFYTIFQKYNKLATGK